MLARKREPVCVTTWQTILLSSFNAKVVYLARIAAFSAGVQYRVAPWQDAQSAQAALVLQIATSLERETPITILRQYNVGMPLRDAASVGALLMAALAIMAKIKDIALFSGLKGQRYQISSVVAIQTSR